MPDVQSIPFKQADPNGHYKSKQLPNDSGDFMLMLGLPEIAGDVSGPGGATANQSVVFADGTGKRIAAASGTGLSKLSSGVLSVVAAPSGAVVGTTDTQTLTNKTLTNPVITGLTGLTKADVGLGNVDNTSDANKPVSTATATALSLKEDKGNKAVANGYASLDATGKVPAAQLPVAGAAAVTSVNTRTGDVVLAKADVGLSNVDNTSDANKPVSTATTTALSLKQDLSAKAAANGYASLGSDGKVPAAQLPSAGSQYQGTWNASTNTPTIPAAAAGNNGWYYNVSVAGTTNINGINTWAIGDQIISNGSVWQKIPNVQAVNSVNGYTGVVVLTKSDVGLGNVDNTSDVNKPISTATSTALGLKQDLSGKGVANGYAGLDSGGKVPSAQLPATTAPVTSVNSKTGDVVVNKTDVVLGNVDNTSDATKNAAIATLTNKTLTSPVINGGTLTSVAMVTPTGITKGDVGLGNVDNTSDATKNAAAVTLTNKTLTTPVINGPTGLVKADVGLGNVDNTSDATKNSATATLTGKTINGANNTLTVRLASDVTGNLPVANLNSGTGASSSSYWRGDGVWAPPAGGGDVVGPGGAADNDVAVFNGATGKILKTTSRQVGDLMIGPASAVDSEVMLFSGTGGKTAKRATGTGYVTVVNGVYQTPTAADLAGRMPRGHLWGLTLANNGTDAVNDIDIAVGEARDATNAVDMVLGSALTKRLDANWVVGNNQGGLDTGTIANSWYHVWLIERTDGTVTDVLFSTSATAPTMPANYTFKRRIGSIFRVAAAISLFSQLGDEFLWKVPVYDLVASNLGATATLYTLTVPTGVQVVAKINALMSHATTANAVYISSPDQTDSAATAMYQIYNDFAAGSGMSDMTVRTSTSGQLRARAKSASTTLNLLTMGYTDDRGRTV